MNTSGTWDPALQIRLHCSIVMTMVMILSAPLTPAASGFLHQHDKITFDKTNFLIFEDVGRQETKDMIAHGKRVVLHATRDGKPVDYDLGSLIFPNAPLSTQVMEIRYRDKDRLWILSRLGHRLDGTVLFNLATRKADWVAAGLHFALSPDARHLAFSFPTGRQMECPMVFVNTVMVYPRVEAGYTKYDFDRGPLKEGGTDFWNTLSEDQWGKTLASEIKWRNNNEITFTMRWTNKDSGHQPVESRLTVIVTGLGDLKNTRQIKTGAVSSRDQEC